MVKPYRWSIVLIVFCAAIILTACEQSGVEPTHIWHVTGTVSAERTATAAAAIVETPQISTIGEQLETLAGETGIWEMFCEEASAIPGAASYDPASATLHSAVVIANVGISPTNCLRHSGFDTCAVIAGGIDLRLELDIQYPDEPGDVQASYRFYDPSDHYPNDQRGLWIPPEWLATEMDELEIVACVSSTTIDAERCHYQPVGSVTWVRQDATVRLIAASTGEVLVEETLEGASDAECLEDERFQLQNARKTRWLQPPTAPEIRGVIGDIVAPGSIIGRDLRGADLAGADLSGMNLVYINLEGASLSEANLRQADLSFARAARTSLTNADLTEANLAATRLVGADLSGANLTGADMNGADMRAAEVENVLWDGTICPDGTNSDDHNGTCENNLDK